MATGRVPTTANSPLTAKGDLFGYSTTQARVPVGNDGETLVADSSTSTGLRWNPAVSGGKNFLINGNFDFFQRGSFSQGSAGYALDRWRIDTANTITVTQQTTGAPNGSRYCMRVAFNATTYSDVMQMMETNTVAPLWGNTVTLQLKLRRNASFTTDIGFTIQKSATVDAGAAATWTTIGTATATNAQLPTGTGASNWYLLTLTVSIPNDGTANSLRVIGGANAAQASGAYWEIAQAQLELGSVATSFSRAGGTLAGELAACRRYFRLGGAGGFGQAYSTTNISYMFQFDTQMRTTPTVTANGQGDVVRFGTGISTSTTWTLGSVYGTANGVGVDVTTNAIGYASGDRVGLSTNSLFFSAEL